MIAIICMVAPILFSLFGKGRYWCGNYCPRGNFYEHVVSKISPNKKVPKFLKSLGFRIAMILLVFFNFGVGMYQNWGNLSGIGLVFYRIIVITSLVGIVLAFFYRPRTWCQFCPMGTIASYIARVRGRDNELAVTNSCVACGLCEKACPMELSPKEQKGDKVTSTDCILCKKCVYVCPKKSITEK
ncbi:iron-sulfur-binding protein [Lachnospiraceae bacterium KM106-2]|nr:iron-sulfur-binding protein [Lachnospiraceae bacterium KM106-2]